MGAPDDPHLAPTSTRRGFLWLSAAFLLTLQESLAHAAQHCLAYAAQLSRAQVSPSGASPMRSVFVAPVSGDGAETVRQDVIQKLSRSGLVRLVKDQGVADATLNLRTVLWPNGAIAVNPRAPGTTYVTYQGYTSAELAGRSQEPLWSYLATPARFHFAGILEDLASQISSNLLQALRGGLAASSATTKNPSTRGMELRAAGATFPAPLYLKWFESFGAQTGGFPIRYEAVGSLAGEEQLAQGTIDMAATDIPAAAPIPAEAPSSEAATIQAAAPVTTGSTAESALLRIPTVVGGVVPIYNLPGALPGTGRELRLTGQVLAGIYAGDVKRWNDPRIRQWNKDAHLPDQEIVVVHRSDGSGTSFAWTHYLSLSSPEWKAGVGAAPAWPTGTGAAGSQGLADLVTRTPYAIGYVELTYAIQQHLSYAAVRNPAGQFIHADLPSITAAAAWAHAHGGDLSGSLLNAPGDDAYPITTFTWLVTPRSPADTQKRIEIVNFLRWMLTSGQKQCSALGYAPLPRDLASDELRTLDAWK